MRQLARIALVFSLFAAVEAMPQDAQKVRPGVVEPGLLVCCRVWAIDRDRNLITALERKSRSLLQFTVPSWTVAWIPDEEPLDIDGDFRPGAKVKIHFWIWRPPRGSPNWKPLDLVRTLREFPLPIVPCCRVASVDAGTSTLEIRDKEGTKSYQAFLRDFNEKELNGFTGAPVAVDFKKHQIYIRTATQSVVADLLPAVLSKGDIGSRRYETVKEVSSGGSVSVRGHQKTAADTQAARSQALKKLALAVGNSEADAVIAGDCEDRPNFRGVLVVCKGTAIRWVP